jgi:hypothetical protein
MVRESSVTVVSGASRIPFERSSRISTFPMALPFINDVGASHASSKTRRRGISECRRHRRRRVQAWHTYLNDPTLADAILDRVVHSSHKIELKATKSLRDPAEAATS